MSIFGQMCRVPPFIAMVTGCKLEFLKKMLELLKNVPNGHGKVSGRSWRVSGTGSYKMLEF